MKMNIFQVDAFTAEPFKGNPAAVCLLDSVMPDSWMRGLAADMNLSETAFLVRKGDIFSLRWLTPEVEVDLCGHATLASAHILWEENILSKESTAQFETKSGLLKADKREDWIELNFPQTPVTEVEKPEGIEKALGASVIYCGKSKFDYFFELDSEDTIKNLAPDYDKLEKLEARGVIVTAQSKEYDFVSRFFAPQSGIDEDPVTGSAHSALYPYWSKKLSKDELSAFQASKRGGNLKLRSDESRVIIAGQAVTIFKGFLNI